MEKQWWEERSGISGDAIGYDPFDPWDDRFWEKS